MKLAKSLSFGFCGKLKDQKFFFLFGAPGVGKGIYGRQLQRDLGMLYLSTTGQIRNIVRGSNTRGMEIDLIDRLRRLIRSGGLVTDDLLMELIKQKVQLPQAGKGLIVDGFPRTERQIKEFLSIFKLSGVLNITLREDVLLQKIKGRRVCIPCRMTYNIHSINRDGYQIQAVRPKIQGKCDGCGDFLSVKQDDVQKIFMARLKEYRLKTDPLLKRFDQMGLLINFQVKKCGSDYPEMLRLVSRKLTYII